MSYLVPNAEIEAWEKTYNCTAREADIYSPAQKVPVPKVKAPPEVPQTAFALKGLPLYPVVQRSSDVPWRTAMVHWSSPLSQSAPSLSVPMGSVQVFSA